MKRGNGRPLYAELRKDHVDCCPSTAAFPRIQQDKGVDELGADRSLVTGSRQQNTHSLGLSKPLIYLDRVWKCWLWRSVFLLILT